MDGAGVCTERVVVDLIIILMPPYGYNTPQNTHPQISNKGKYMVELNATPQHNNYPNKPAKHMSTLSKHLHPHSRSLSTLPSCYPQQSLCTRCRVLQAEYDEVMERFHRLQKTNGQGEIQILGLKNEHQNLLRKADGKQQANTKQNLRRNVLQCKKQDTEDEISETKDQAWGLVSTHNTQNSTQYFTFNSSDFITHHHNHQSNHSFGNSLLVQKRKSRKEMKKNGFNLQALKKNSQKLLQLSSINRSWRPTVRYPTSQHFHNENCKIESKFCQ